MTVDSLRRGWIEQRYQRVLSDTGARCLPKPQSHQDPTQSVSDPIRSLVLESQGVEMRKLADIPRSGSQTAQTKPLADEALIAHMADLTRSMLCIDPERWPTMAKVLEQPVLNLVDRRRNGKAFHLPSDGP